MSPTSYQTAPPRGVPITITEGSLLENRGSVGVATIGAVEESALIEGGGHRVGRAGLPWGAGRRRRHAFHRAPTPLRRPQPPARLLRHLRHLHRPLTPPPPPARVFWSPEVAIIATSGLQKPSRRTSTSRLGKSSAAISRTAG